ncbi:MAG TPA: MarR family transcriptional regulator [Solirubrobacteraceae bacterium]|nr:MarR family transcriptional regulator [Solirubrobacteraceae bacterium]
MQHELSHDEQMLSSSSPERLRAWRLFFESALALLDTLEHDFQRDAGFPVQWYDVLVHLEETPDGLRTSELAQKVLFSKSGFTRVVDKMEAAGLVRRVRPENDRRSIFILQTPEGRAAMQRARPPHHRWVEENFTGLLTDSDIKAITRAFEKISAHARTLRPGRVNG